MHRRKFLESTSALIGLLPVMHLKPFGIYNTSDDTVQMQVGNFKCTIFKDFTFRYRAKDFFINAAPEELDQSLKKHNTAADNITSPFIAILLEQGDKKIIIDTGVGSSKNPVNVRGTAQVINGRLSGLLQQQNIRHGDITDVIITHFHPDHIGGIYSEEGNLNFINARFHMHADEWNYWHSSQADNQPAQFKHFIEKNITKLKGLNLHLISGDFVDVLRGITAVKAEGHTPGQIALIIHSGKEHLLYISDAMLHPSHIERVDWQTNYDLDHDKAKASRIKLLDLAYKDNMLVNAFHFEFPGLGRIEKHERTWAWQYQKK